MMNTQKEHTHAPRGGFGRLLAVSAFGASLALPLSAQTSLFVDFGEDSGPVQSGYENGNIATGTATSFQFEYERDFGNGTFSGTNNLRLKVQDKNGSNFKAANRVGDGVAPLANLTSDFIRAGDDTSDVDLFFDGLEDGEYEFTAYTNNEPNGGSDYRILDTNGNFNEFGSTSSTGGVIDTITFSFTVGAGSATFDDFASGSTVGLRVNQVGGSASESQINGFDLAQVPEPQSFALIGGLLALGAVMLRRRARG